MRRCCPRARRSGRPGFSLVEVVMSVVVVATLFVAALKTVGASRVGQFQISRQDRGLGLAQDLMSEILTRAYREPVDTPVFGRETGETNGPRQVFDDVDDYHNWVETPPQNPDGTAMPGLANWQREVVVEYVDPTNLLRTVAGDMGIKRITVTVRYRGTIAARLIAVQTDVGDATGQGAAGGSAGASGIQAPGANGASGANGAASAASSGNGASAAGQQ